jgi:membrane protein implicated in regulation of membrane protease activity
MDENDTIKALQSSTFKAALTSFILSALTLVTVFTGVVFDIAFIKAMLEAGITMIPALATMWLAYKAMRGRMATTKQIEGKYAEKLRADANK